MARSSGKVTIKKYANRRLYDTESSTYITLDRLAEMVREGREFEKSAAGATAVCAIAPDSGTNRAAARMASSFI